jgi:predicted nucleic acid-binding Zn finger protein
MADTADRILGALTDVVAVEHVAPGMVRVVTVSGAYVVDARHESCECPDFEYNLDGAERCKHLWAALDATDQYDLGTHRLEESLNEPTPLPDFENFDRRVEYV